MDFENLDDHDKDFLLFSVIFLGAIATHNEKILRDSAGEKYRILDFTGISPGAMLELSNKFFNRDYFTDYHWLLSPAGELKKLTEVDLVGWSNEYTANIADWRHPTDLIYFRLQKDIFLERITEINDPPRLIQLAHEFIKVNLSGADYSCYRRFLGGGLDENGVTEWVGDLSDDIHSDITNLLNTIFWALEEAQNGFKDRISGYLQTTSKHLDW